MRILVTGSRNWTDPDPIHGDLRDCLVTYTGRERRYTDDEFIVVHGHCPTGADHIADQWAIAMDVSVERYVAEWSRLGKIAGFHRNSEMVNDGADLCLAYVMPCKSPRCPRLEVHGSHGATDTYVKAQDAGIKTVVRKRGFI